MKTTNPPLPSGYSPLPPGQIANVVTCLEMRARPDLKPVAPLEALSLRQFEKTELKAYRSLFRAVGEDWLWLSRLAISDSELEAVFTDPGIESCAVVTALGEPVGLLELDFRVEGECELVFFGLVPGAIGKGAGRWLMNQAITRAFQRPIERFWLHTCSFDHPSALGFYQSSGFKPYATLVEVAADPRLTGEMRRDAARHVPLIEPAVS